jgi:hypothetical protein
MGMTVAFQGGENISSKKEGIFSTYTWSQARRRIIDVRIERKRLGDSEHFVDWIHTKLDVHR